MCGFRSPEANGAISPVEELDPNQQGGDLIRA